MHYRLCDTRTLLPPPGLAWVILELMREPHRNLDSHIFNAALSLRGRGLVLGSQVRRRRRRRRRRTLKLLHQVVSATHIGARCLFLAVGCRVGCMQVAVKLQDHVSCVYLLPLGRLSEHLDFIITFSISISHLYHPLHLSSRNFENFSSQALLKNFDTFCKYELLRSGWDHNFLKKQEEMTSSRLWEGH